MSISMASGDVRRDRKILTTMNPRWSPFLAQKIVWEIWVLHFYFFLKCFLVCSIISNMCLVYPYKTDQNNDWPIDSRSDFLGTNPPVFLDWVLRAPSLKKLAQVRVNSFGRTVRLCSRHGMPAGSAKQNGKISPMFAIPMVYYWVYWVYVWIVLLGSCEHNASVCSNFPNPHFHWKERKSTRYDWYDLLEPG